MDSRRLERLIELGPALTERLDLEHVLTRVVDESREITGARYGALGVVAPSGDYLERFITSGLSAEERAAIGDLPRGHGVLGELIANPVPLRLPEVGAHPRSYGFPAGHPPMSTFLGVPVRAGDSVYGNLYLTEKEGGAEFDQEDEDAVVMIARWAGAAIENARAHRRLDERHAQLQRRVRLLETTDEITRAVGAETDLDRVLELIVKRGRALVEARGVVLATMRAGDVIATNIAGDLDTAMLGMTLSADRSVAGWALEHERPARLGDVPEAAKSVIRETMDVEAALVVPMTFRDRPLGVIEAFDRLVDGPEFNDEDERLLCAFANSAAIAIATAQSAAEQSLRRSINASERERRRWARELHDDTLQQIGALRMILQGALQTHDPERLETAAAQAIDELAHASSSLRDLITDLRPAVLDELGVGAALSALAQRARGRSDADIGVHVDLAYERGQLPTRLAPIIENTIYRVTQEALNNALRHAEAERIEIGVVEDPHTVEVSVRDDGAGFDLSDPHQGFGLTGMQERVAEAGGRFTLESGERGTTIDVVLPAVRSPDESAQPAATGHPAPVP